MIFVTVGTHEQQFNRLVKYMDELAGSGKIKDDIVMQIGYSDYVPKYAKYSKFYTYDDMKQLYNDARIIITHGGPSSFMMALMIGKVPIVVPRKYEFGEHVNNHQVTFCTKVKEEYNNIELCDDIKELDDMIIKYNDKLVSVKSNNEEFCHKFTMIIDGLKCD